MTPQLERDAERAAQRTAPVVQANMSAAPLKGLAIVVTRPAGQAAGLAEAIRGAGGEAILFPTIDIRDAADAGALDRALDELDGAAWAIFVSPNAVEKTFARLDRAWPASVRVAAIGPGTGAALAQHGARGVLMPAQRFDSEGLLALPEFSAVAGARCVIFRGNGGRELIAETLAARGAKVKIVECYQRALPAADAGPLLERWATGNIAALTFASSEGARNFMTLAGAAARPLAARTPAFVPHANIARTVARLGFRDVVETGAAQSDADAGLLAALCARFGAR